MNTDFTGANNAGKKNKMSGFKIIKKERRLQAIGMRKRGLTYAEIGKEMGVSRQAAYSYVEREFTHMLKEGNIVAEKALSLTLARFDELLKVYYTEALQGNRQSLDCALAIMDRQIKLLGIEAPKRTEATVTYQSMSDHELAAQANMWGITYTPEPLKIEAKPT